MELGRRNGNHTVMVFRREGFFLPAVESVCGPVREIGIRRLASVSTLFAVRRLAVRLRREKFNILHTWDADAAFFGRFAAAWARVPLVTSRRDLGQIYAPFKVRGLRAADARASAVVANAQAIIEHFVSQGEDRVKFRVIPNILDVAEFDRLHREPFPRENELPSGERIVMVSRLDPEKDIPMFIRAATLVSKLHPNAGFVIAGDGVERTNLEAMVRHSGMAGRIRFLGDTTAIPSLLAHASIGALTPSRNEGLSNTILEYMAAGLPVVATECGGNRELVDPPNGGVMVNPGDDDAAAAAMVDLLRKPALRKSMGEHNRRRVEQVHQPKAVGDLFDAVYWSVTAR